MVHLGKGEIEDFLAGRLEASNRRRVILHLLDGCSLCQRRLRSLAEPLLGEEPWAAAEPVTEESYDEALSRRRRGEVVPRPLAKGEGEAPAGSLPPRTVSQRVPGRELPGASGPSASRLAPLRGPAPQELRGAIQRPEADAGSGRGCRGRGQARSSGEIPV